MAQGDYVGKAILVGTVLVAAYFGYEIYSGRDPFAALQSHGVGTTPTPGGGNGGNAGGSSSPSPSSGNVTPANGACGSHGNIYSDVNQAQAAYNAKGGPATMNGSNFVGACGGGYVVVVGGQWL
ncbi:MAG: hypothetical protein KGL39_12090 [Patescibacteria group bacterium]|nr:hypothetical protein [Patescibacteria group bacterium]